MTATDTTAATEYRMVSAEDLTVGDVIVRRKNDGTQTRRRVVRIDANHGTANGNGFGKVIRVYHVAADGEPGPELMVAVGYWFKVRIETGTETAR